MRWLMVVMAMVLGLGCSPSKAQEKSSPAAEDEKKSPDAQQPPPAPEIPEEDKAARFVRLYNEGKTVLETKDPTIVFVARFEASDCTSPLPEKRPEGFEASFWRRTAKRGQSPKLAYFGFSSSICHFQRALHLDAPPVQCAVLDAAAFDALYARLRELELHAIQVALLEDVSPHRGGFGVSVRWPGANCEISDILRSKVEDASRPAFESALQALRDARPKPPTSSP